MLRFNYLSAVVYTTYINQMAAIAAPNTHNHGKGLCSERLNIS